jgi:hypothetical protein
VENERLEKLDLAGLKTFKIAIFCFRWVAALQVKVKFALITKRLLHCTSGYGIRNLYLKKKSNLPEFSFSSLWLEDMIVADGNSYHHTDWLQRDLASSVNKVVYLKSKSFKMQMPMHTVSLLKVLYDFFVPSHVDSRNT